MNLTALFLQTAKTKGGVLILTALFKNLWAEDSNIEKLAGALSSGKKYRAMVSGLDYNARSFFMAVLGEKSGRPTLIITADSSRAEKVRTEVAEIYAGRVDLCPARDTLTSSDLYSRSREYEHMRLEFLNNIRIGENGFYVVEVKALLPRLIPVVVWDESVLSLKIGQQLDRQDLIKTLVASGFQRSAITETRGFFSARGDVIDIYSPGCSLPLRIEFFDNQIHSLRSYDPATQRSIERVNESRVLPACELVLTEKKHYAGLQAIQDRQKRVYEDLLRRGEKETARKFSAEIDTHLEKLVQPAGLDSLGGYFSYFYGRGASMFDYLDPEFVIFVDDPPALVEAAEKYEHEIEQVSISSPVASKLFSGKDKPNWNTGELFSRLSYPVAGFSLFPGTGGLFRPFFSLDLETKSTPYYHGLWDLFKSDYRGWLDRGYRVHLLSSTESRGKKLVERLTEQGILGAEEALPPLPVTESNMIEGLIIPGLNVVLVTEHDLLPRKKKIKRLRTGGGVRLSDYRELAAGDYVVHEQHGIGLYQGLNTLEIGGVERDYLLLKYRGSDKLYIPVDQIGLVQKYSGGEGQQPRLHSLGGAEWQRLKSRIDRSVEELAGELLSLYAARKAVKGYSFGPDNPWQQEFETHFPYEETADQVQAVAEIKADLEKDYPMDRLVCGDVGYGKTEVAMRAAFKVVMEGKQVAILVPTTVLAQQHFRTFTERFNGFPVRIAVLSRFVSRQEQKEVLAETAAGKIDIIIGTHRLLSSDVGFHDLGLLVLDEEQRFGVRQKEKLKKMRLEVDILAMTATPIPRTLQFSLVGARDLSLIDTPPEDRYPVQTYVLEYSDGLVREAVLRELNRNGQVFIVFNRIERIEDYARKIRTMFPGVDVAVGHGRMPEKKLEKIMTDFQDGRYQVLVCTTIIESGLDIPNVNTLIVYEADRFGLAQLYQIRGRVGRSNRPASAYLTFRREKVISEIAQKRLKAVKEFTELGSGFKVALRDLEIRGAGNILGAEQHGFINAVGFDLYSKLLNQAVARLKDEKPPRKADPRLDLHVSAYIPSAYISDHAQKIDFYKRIYDSFSAVELQEIKQELVDRFGPAPVPVNNLIRVALLRGLAVELGIESIRQAKKTIIQFGSGVESEMIYKIRSCAAGRVKIRSDRPLKIELNEVDESGDSLTGLLLLLEELSAPGIGLAGIYRQV